MVFFQRLKNIFNKKPKSKIPDQKFMRVYEYQFTNLIINRIPCLLLDLRVEEQNKPVIKRSLPANVTNFMTTINELAKDSGHPIVLFCDDGKLSLKIADQLVENKYFNVVVLEGGIRSLSPSAKIQIQI